MEINVSIKVGDIMWGKFDDLPYVVSEILEEGLYDGKNVFTIMMIGRDDKSKRDHLRVYGERISEEEIQAVSSI